MRHDVRTRRLFVERVIEPLNFPAFDLISRWGGGNNLFTGRFVNKLRDRRESLMKRLAMSPRELRAFLLSFIPTY